MLFVILTDDRRRADVEITLVSHKDS